MVPSRSGIKRVNTIHVLSKSWMTDGPSCAFPEPGFVNAQYRFVMNPGGDYTVHFADPDMYADAAGVSMYSLTLCITVSFNGRIYFK